MYWLVFVSLLSVIWSFPLLLFSCFGLRLFYVSSREKVNSTLKLLEGCWSSISTYDSRTIKPQGFFIGRWFAGYVFYQTLGNMQFRAIYILTTKSFMEKAEELSKPKETENPVTVLLRHGNYCNILWTIKKVVPRALTPRPDQLELLDKICTQRDDRGNCVAFISGSPGSGKSSIATLLASRLKAKLCYTFNPTDPGDTLATLICEADPSKEHPLIILFDEVDAMIHRVHNIIPLHKSIPISIYDKTTFNSWMDHLIDGESNVILILTSNNTAQEIGDKYDSCYLRHGRVSTFLTL